MKKQDIKRRPLSDTVLATLEPEKTTYRVSDGQGLYFRVKPSGQKSWELRYKKPDGKWSWLGLGGYPDVGGAEARNKVAQMRIDAASGKEPVATRKARREAEQFAASMTFEKLATEWFQTRRANWEEGTARRVIGALRLHVFPVFGHRPLTEILPMEWMTFFRGLEDKGIIDQAGNIRRYCSEIYGLAKVTGRAVHNPLEGLHKFLATRPSENYAHVTPGELPDLLRAISAYPSARDLRLGLRLLMLTCVRPSELREAPWSEFDTERKLWVIPAHRMKKRRGHVVPLCRQAMEALESLRAITGHYPLLFPGRNDRTKPRSNMAFNMALRRMGYAGRQTGHGFRHIASTMLRENGFPREYVEAQLAHAEEGVAGVYNKAIYLEQRREMMQWYADRLDVLEKGNIVTGNFTNLAESN